MKSLFSHLTAVATIIGMIEMANPSTAQAATDQTTYDFSLVTTNAGSKAYTIYGEIEAVHVTIPTAKTATVSVASAEDTFFSKAGMTSATDGMFYPMAPVQDAGGTNLLSVTDGGTNSVPLRKKFVAAGAVTVTVTPPAALTGTNAYSVKVIYKK